MAVVIIIALIAVCGVLFWIATEQSKTVAKYESELLKAAKSKKTKASRSKK